MSKYSYNGHVLPEIPVVDGYPYVYMYTITGESLDEMLGEYAGQSECMYAAHYSSIPYTYDGERFGIRTTGERAKFYAYVPEANESFTFYQDYVIGDNTSNFGLPVESDVDQKVFWCNTDLVYEDGSIFLAASEPVSTVFVLPDGTELPALPEGCFEKYPYGMILRNENASPSDYQLYVFEVPGVYVPSELNGAGYEFVDIDGKYASANLNLSQGDTDWSEVTYNKFASAQIIVGELADFGLSIAAVWSNHDILTATACEENDDGSFHPTEIGPDLYHRSDVNYRIYGGWLNSMANEARRLGSVTGGMNPGEMESVIKGVEVGSDPVLQEKTATPTTSQQEIVYDEGYDGLSKVIIEAATLQEKTVTPTASAQEVTSDDGYYGLSKLTVEAAPLKELTVTPTTEAQTFTPESPYIGFSVVNVGAAEGGSGGGTVEELPSALEVGF